MMSTNQSFSSDSSYSVKSSDTGTKSMSQEMMKNVIMDMARDNLSDTNSTASSSNDSSDLIDDYHRRLSSPHSKKEKTQRRRRKLHRSKIKKDVSIMSLIIEVSQEFDFDSSIHSDISSDTGEQNYVWNSRSEDTKKKEKLSKGGKKKTKRKANSRMYPNSLVLRIKDVINDLQDLRLENMEQPQQVQVQQGNIPKELVDKDECSDIGTVSTLGTMDSTQSSRSKPSRQQSNQKIISKLYNPRMGLCVQDADDHSKDTTTTTSDLEVDNIHWNNNDNKVDNSKVDNFVVAYDMYVRMDMINKLKTNIY